MMSPFDDSQGNLRPDDESEEFDSVPPTPMLDVHRALLPPPASAAPERNTLLRFQLPPLALLLLLLKTLEPPSQGSKEVDDNTFDQELPAKMLRHRWGTTRHKLGHPKAPHRLRTLKQFLHHGHPHKKGLIRKPNTLEDGEIDNPPDVEENDPRDHKAEHRTVVFNRLLPDEMLDDEGKPDTDYPRNKIRTTKYTPLLFLPKNILNQFLHNVANIYFLVLIILGAFDIFGVPLPILAAVPLIVIVLITAVKDGIEDLRRTVVDMEINNQGTHILQQNLALASNYNYINNNVNDEQVLLWRRIKKATLRGMFRALYGAKARMLKEGRAKRARERAQQNVEQRKLFELGWLGMLPRQLMELAALPRQLMDNPFGDTLYPLGQRRTPYHQQKTLKFTKRYWKDVRVGDVLRIYNNDEIPADVVILATSDDDHCCYVETKNLDGETNLKVRQALKYGGLGERPISRADDFVAREFQIDSEGPHPNLYLYQGNLCYGNDQQEAITINNMLLRGCLLRNTKWVIAIVVFTGADTKIMLNAGVTPTKQLRMLRQLNYYVFLNFLLLFVMCFVLGLVNGIWYNNKNELREWYEFGTIAGTPAKNGIVLFFVALILYQLLVPISLYITIEIIKTAQVFFIYLDLGMYYARLDYPCTPKLWSISDDLGQIEYVFSDKTGTLTQNLMEFKKCTIAGKAYGRAYTEALAGLRKRQGVDVEKEAAIEREAIEQDRIKMVDELNTLTPSNAIYNDEITFVSLDFVFDLSKQDRQAAANMHFMLCLSLCHLVLVEPDKKHPGKQLLKAQLPDEAALVGTARSLGYNFKQLTKTGVIIEVQGREREYTVLNTLEFNSTRKRMLAIVKFEEEGKEPRCLLICKGADLIIYGRLLSSNDKRPMLEATLAHLEQFATEGLRTLCIAQRELSWEQYHRWNERHKEAASLLENREEKMEAVADEIERELTLLGGTAIEDRLQDGVPEAIQLLADAGMKLWVLTGDKVETAINIGFSCNLLGNDMELLLLKTKYSEEEVELYGVPDLMDGALIAAMIELFLRNFPDEPAAEPDLRFALVVDGDALKIALTQPKFLTLCRQCKAVLCCRVLPAQKAAVVKLVKEGLGVMTLAIGDGSNDVAMIQSADVGVGIAGEEGRQAAMSSDYAFGQFRYLARLLLVHGRWLYKRFSEMIPSFFYKNCIFTMALFWYGVYNNFDGLYLFEFTYLMFVNLAFTSLPVIFLGVFDQDVLAKVSLLVPQLYVLGIRQLDFTQAKFWWYMIDAVYQLVIAFFFPYLVYYISFIQKGGKPVDHRFMMGIIVTCILCMSCNLYILMHQYRWDWLSVLIVAISILIIFIWTGLWTINTYAGEFFKAAPRMFGNASFWACLWVGILVCLIPRFFYDTLQRMYNPKDVDLIRECVQRGDFDSYPEDFDPTDPNRATVSDYTAENTRRISMSRPLMDRSPYGHPNENNSSVYTETIAMQEF